MLDVPIIYFVAGIPMLVMLWNWIGPGSLRHIPTVGPSIPILAYLNGLRFIKHAKEMMMEGYEKHASRGGIFKVSMPDQWLVLIAGPTLIDEARKMPEDALSPTYGADELLAARHVLGLNVVEDPYHLQIIHSKISRNMSEFYGIQKDEVWNGFKEGVGFHDEWHSVPALKTMVDIVARTTNRVFVGLPLCRDPAFLSVATSFTMDVSKSRLLVNLFPPFLKAPVAKIINRVPGAIDRAHAVLEPTIQERRVRVEESLKTGEAWEDKPNDLLMWLIEAGVKKGFSNRTITQYLLVVEFTAIHTTAMSITQALYYLAANPSLATPLREEVEAVLASDGGEWGKGTVGKFHKVDSFLRESQRLNGINATTVWRRTLKPITFSTGVTVPAGVFVCAAATPTHIDEQHYQNPTAFDPWRFLKPAGSSDSVTQSFVSTSVDYIAFGHGRHACPGRHFASYQMKLMLVFIVLNYDVSFEPGKEGERPENKWFGNSIIPEPTVNIMFRKRRA